MSVQRSDATACVTIRDSGIGISPEHLDDIFGIFSQVEDGRGGGLGIGLALVRGFVELHGGSIRVHSAGVGQGTEFIVELPLHEVHRRAVAAPVLAGDYALQG